MSGDVGNGVVALALLDLIAVDTHVGVIGVGEQAYYAGLFGQQAVAQFVFPVFGVNLPGPPDQVDPVRDLRHKRFGEAKTPVAILVIGDQSDGVTAGVGGIVPCAVV